MTFFTTSTYFTKPSCPKCLKSLLLMDISKKTRSGIFSIGGYHTLLPKDIFERGNVNGIYSSFQTKTEPPSIKFYLGRGIKNINGWILKGIASTSLKIKEKVINFNGTIVGVRDYSIRYKGLRAVKLQMETELSSNKNISLKGQLGYQNGFGPKSADGLEAMIKADINF